LLLRWHPFPPKQAFPVTFTRARFPEMTAPSTVIFPVGMVDDFRPLHKDR